MCDRAGRSALSAQARDNPRPNHAQLAPSMPQTNYGMAVSGPRPHGTHLSTPFRYKGNQGPRRSGTARSLPQQERARINSST